jgi:hypothetical protein
MRPLIVKVFEKQTGPAMGGIGGLFGGGGAFGALGGGRGGRGGAAGARGGFAGLGEPSAETQALRTIVADDAAKPEDIQAKLKAYRDARKKAEEELKTAREDLRKLCNARQEAELVLTGTLD